MRDVRAYSLGADYEPLADLALAYAANLDPLVAIFPASVRKVGSRLPALCLAAPRVLIPEAGTGTAGLRIAPFSGFLPVFLMAALLLTVTRSFDRARSAATQKSTAI